MGRRRAALPDAVDAPSSLRAFLVQRFIAVAGAIAVLEILVTSLEQGFLIPWLTILVQGDIGKASLGEVARLALAAVSDAIAGGSNVPVALAEMSGIFLMLAFCVALLVLPIVAGAFAFASLTQRRIDAEQRAREEERALFYERRNLLISDMAHDLRTPITTVVGMSQALADGMVDYPVDRHRYLKSIVAKATKMADLVNTLFDFVKLDSEGFHLDRATVDLPQLVLAEAAALYADVEAAGMELSLEVSEEPVPVFADAVQLKRVIGNLIANAVRHTDEGTEILVSLVRKAGVADVVVADTGRPIEGDAQSLFDPFVRGDASRSGEGSGLGLAIAARIVRMHGYRIRIDQPYGRFSKAFVVTCRIEDEGEFDED